MSTVALISSLDYKIERQEPELIVPAKPTPYEFKYLSDIDDQKSLRFNLPTMHFYRNVVGMEGRDPAKVIKEAIGKALVYYYPLAGRLREGANDKLMVECTGEGVVFVEANAHVRLDQFGDVLLPPFPGAEGLLSDVPGFNGIVHCPLLLMQVTRFICGGFVLAVRLNHTLTDAIGLHQFMTAIGEIARGEQEPTIQPIWKRELLNAREPPQVTCTHHVYEDLSDSKAIPVDNMIQLIDRSFFFGTQEIAGLRKHVPLHLQSCSTFEILTACLWRGRTIALSPNLGDKVGIACAVNARAKLNPPLPPGFYGNAFVLPVAVSTCSQLCQNPLSYALELVKEAIEDVNEEFIRSSIDLLAKKRSSHISAALYYISDITRIRYRDVDYGWGKAVYAGHIQMSHMGGFFIPCRNKEGKDGIVMQMTLPGPAMEKFITEIDKMIRDPDDRNSSFIVSQL